LTRIGRKKGGRTALFVAEGCDGDSIRVTMRLSPPRSTAMELIAARSVNVTIESFAENPST
jgi:hypothetical protein